MKRALSLIIVLAMVLCMIPFSAFAADFGIATDFVDGVINLSAENDYKATYLWTATEEGDLEIFAEPVLPPLEDGEEAPDLAVPYIEVDGEDYEAAIHVVPGESYEITIGDLEGLGGDITVRTKFTGLPGTESNPYPWYNPVTGLAPEDQGEATVAVEAGASVYYELWYYAGATLRISGVGVKAVKVFEDNTIDGTEAGYVEFDLAPSERSVLIKITNKSDAAQTYTFESIVPVGTQNNPEVISDGTYTVKLAEGNQGYFYSYTAEGDGTVSIEVSAAGTIAGTDAEGNPTERNVGWQYTVNPFAGGESHFSDDTEVVNPAIVEVTAGQEIVFVVGTYDPYAYGPAGSITTVVSFEEATEEPPVDPDPEPPVDPEPEEPTPIEITELPFEASHTGIHTQFYTYTATAAGYLYVTTSDGEDGGFVNFDVWGAESYGDGYILAMNEGETVTIEVATYWGEVEDVTYDYTFSWKTEVEPDGSSAFPFVVETILPDGITLTNEGEDAVYYNYIAEKDGKIFNSFWEAEEEIAAGDAYQIYVPAGESVTVSYVPPVAIVDGVDYFELQDAINAAALIAGDSNPVTVVMLSSYATDGTIIIPANVIVDIATYDLAAANLFVLSGGNIFSATGRYAGSTGHGTVSVAKDNVVITTDSAVVTNATNGMCALPVWLPAEDCYVFLNARVLDNTYTLDKENNSVVYKWKQAGATAYTNLLKVAGGTDIGVRFCVKASWFTGTADVDLSFWYTPEMVRTIANSSTTMATFGLNGLDILGANYANETAYDTFEVRACFVTDCGVCVYGSAK